MTKKEEITKDLKEIEVVDLEVVQPEELTEEQAVGQIPLNIPYKKILNDEGVLVNPITKEDPYLNNFMSGEQKRSLIKKATKHPKNNKKGIRLVITPFAKGKFTKTEVVKQRIEEGVERDIENKDGEIIKGTKTHKARTIIHNKTNVK